MFEITDVYRPECGDPAEGMPPENWPVSGEVPSYRHVPDGSLLVADDS